jgi:hypothetical protein
LQDLLALSQQVELAAMNTRQTSRPRRAGRSSTSIVLLLATVAALAAGASSALGASSIEGIWSFGGGQIAIRPGSTSGTFEGVVTATTTFAECPHPVGQPIWTGITQQPDGSYWGQHFWYFEKTNCTENPERGPAAWRVVEEANGSKYLRVCLSTPGTSQPTIAAIGAEANVTYNCYDSELLAPLPTAGQAGFINSLKPGATKCVSGRHFEIHLAEPAHDPFKAVRITLRGKRIKPFHRGYYVDAIVDLKGLPLGAFTIKVSAKTVLGVTLTGSRTYHTCAKKPKPHKPAKLKRAS